MGGLLRERGGRATERERWEGYLHFSERDSSRVPEHSETSSLTVALRGHPTAFQSAMPPGHFESSPTAFVSYSRENNQLVEGA